LAERHSGVERAVLTDALEQLAVGGVKALTIEGVAARTGISKTTLYRRWRSKEDLALAVLLEMARMATTSAAVDGDVRASLVGYLRAVIGILRDTPFGRVMQGLVSDLATDPQMAHAFRTEVIALRQQHLGELVQQGVDAGILRGDLDLRLVQELFFGPVYYRLLFSGHPFEDDLAERIVDSVLPGMLLAPHDR
jgi:AcrR family transcriptional regulator